MTRILLAGVIALTAGRASADTTATYKSAKFPISMTIEIATNGDLRGTMPNQPGYFITKRGEGYMIQTTAAGTVVDRVTDLAMANGEIMAKAMPDMKAAFHDHQPVIDLVEQGTATVGGRTGTAYFMKNGAGQVSPFPIVVISHDPDLAPLGAAMARQFQMSLTMMSQMTGSVPDFGTKMEKLLSGGAPLTFSGMDLMSISTTPIPAAHFDLPGRPETLDAIRHRLEASAPKPK